MPIIKSAKKRVRVAEKAAIRNSKTKRALKLALKGFQSAVTSSKDAVSAHAKAQSAIDTAVKKGVLHKNKAARKKQQLAAQAKKAGAKVTTPSKAKTPAAKKPAATKSAPKKTTTTSAKKPAAKKPAATKSAPKKTTKK